MSDRNLFEDVEHHRFCIIFFGGRVSRRCRAFEGCRATVLGAEVEDVGGGALEAALNNGKVKMSLLQ